MENIKILSSEEFEKINNTLNSILEKLDKNNPDKLLDNVDFQNYMHISKRTAQTWRDDGIIAYSQILGKVYYRMEDINKMIEKYHILPKKYKKS